MPSRPCVVLARTARIAFIAALSARCGQGVASAAEPAPKPAGAGGASGAAVAPQPDAVSIAGWQRETFPLPPGFAPELPAGSESLRFSSGWRDPKAEGFWSYAFVMWIDEPAPDAARLKDLLGKYYNGLLAMFAADKGKDISATPARVDVTGGVAGAGGVGGRYEAKMRVIDAFATFEPIDLRLLIETVAAGDARSTVRIRVSPQPKEHAIWPSLQAAVADILAHDTPGSNPAPGQNPAPGNAPGNDPAPGKSPGARGAPHEALDYDAIAGSAWQVGPTIVAGQPSEAALRDLAKKGVKAVISLRSDRELSDRRNVPFDEPALVRSLGMEFIQAPLGVSWHYTPEALDRVAEAIKKYDGNVLLHCTVGFRATTVWAAHRARDCGMSLDEALAEGRQMGLGIDNIEALAGRKVEYRFTDEPAERAAGWLVTGDWLAEHGGEKNVRALDVRPNYLAYFEGHAKGATHLDAHTLRGPSGGLPVQFRAMERMAEIFAQAGVTPSQRAVVYADGGDILSATMAMYALEKLGHLNTSLLDGGVSAAKSAGLLTQEFPKPVAPAAASSAPPASATLPAATAPAATPAPAQTSGVSAAGATPKPAAPAPPAPTFDAIDNAYCAATLTDVEAGLTSKGVLFVDARPPEQYEGKTNIWRRNGHIPGAVNVFWKRLTADDNTSALRPRPEIEQVFASAGVTPDREVIVYCGTGREATLIYMYLTRELGFQNVRLFEGAWTQYANEDRLPVEK